MNSDVLKQLLAQVREGKLPVDAAVKRLRTLPFEDLAIKTYIKNTELLSQTTYDQWIKKSYQQLRLLFPVRYDKEEKIEGVIDVPL